MQTDVPLKLLTALRGADLLPLLGLPAAVLVGVETRELPARAARLDTLLRVRTPQGQDYLHVLEWQGYADAAVLWRLAGYVAWFGQQEPATTVVGTVVYLAPEYDVGETLTQTLDGQVVQTWQLRRVQLWTLDARAALASGNLGLAVLSPLMHNADVQLVEDATRLVLQQAPLTQQGDLLSILGMFAVPLMHTQRFIDLVGRETLMTSELFEVLIRERLAEVREEVRTEVRTEVRKQYEAQIEEKDEQIRQQAAQLRQEEEKRRQEEVAFREELQYELQQVLEETLIMRFPALPFTVARRIRRIRNPVALRQLILAVQQAPDLAAVEQILQAAVDQEEQAGDA